MEIKEWHTSVRLQWNSLHLRLCRLHVIRRLIDRLLVLRDDLCTGHLADHDRIHVTAWVHIAVRVDHLLIHISTGLLWIGQYLGRGRSSLESQCVLRWV